MGKDHPWPSLTFFDFPWPSMTIYGLLSPSKTYVNFYDWMSIVKTWSNIWTTLTLAQINSHSIPKDDPIDFKSSFFKASLKVRKIIISLFRKHEVQSSVQLRIVGLHKKEGKRQRQA